MDGHHEGWDKRLGETIYPIASMEILEFLKPELKVKFVA